MCGVCDEEESRIHVRDDGGERLETETVLSCVLRVGADNGEAV